jgi:hypothetical protein
VDEPTRYEFRFAEPLSERLQGAFAGLEVPPTGDSRVLYGPVRDQDELAGLLARFSSMRLTLLDMHRLPD